MIGGTARTKWRMSLADRYQMHHRRVRCANDNEPKPERVSRQLADLEAALQRYHATFGTLGRSRKRSGAAPLRPIVIAMQTLSRSG